MRNLNPNQFALPGMEEQAHPLARHLAQGVRFKTSESVAPVARADMDDPRGPSYRVPRSFDPEVAEHSLLAVVPSPRPKETVEGVPGRLAGELHWRGDAQTRPHQYPGEITYVGRGKHATEDLYRDEGVWKSHHPFPSTPGLMTSMFQFAHQNVQPGQTTVPVHSTDRSGEGEAWARKVGPPELTPKRNEDTWRPPKGVHPYEAEAKKAAKPPKKIKGQRKLF